ncbi:transposase family protein [Catenuloplanes japonicus]|uniref:transposase family protein n=1 Tax=Catenuloplanes japonicus TaxID=33876 RepID=UPI001E30B0D7|nr:transposase family protein [Catenuloplanes japonicus]
MAVCAVLAGASSFAAITDWLRDLDAPARSRLGSTGRLPAGTTVWRVLTRLDDALLSAILAGWLHSRTPAPPARPRRCRTVIAIDGKVLRGARRNGRQVHLLSALDTAPASFSLRSPSTRRATKSRPSHRCSTPSNEYSGPSPECCSPSTHSTPDQPRQRGRPARSPPARPGESQPTDLVHPAQTAALGANPSR